MPGYSFKTHIVNGREYFEYGEQKLGEVRLTKKDFPFPESLLRLMYLDIWSLEPLTKRIDKALRDLYPSRDEAHAQTVLDALDELASAHIYFEFLRLGWRNKIERSRFLGYEGAVDALPHKQIAQLPSDIAQMQEQIKTLFANVLDMDSGTLPVQKRMARYYHAHGSDTLHTFQFRPLPLRYEFIDEDTFAEVLCPQSIYDLIDYSVRECVKREQRMRLCKNCGHYFAVTLRSTMEYCSITTDAKGRTCKDIGSIALWTKNKSSDDAFKAYRREYKTRFARMRRGGLDPQEVYDWGERAREKKAECDAGKLTLEEFSEWLKNS